jgi:hypothetical protein
MGGEPGRGPDQEPGAGLALLVGMDLGVGQPGVVVDRAVHVVVADPSSRPLLGLGATVLPGVPAMDPPAATGTDHPELLHVHMHQLARPGPLVTAHDLTGGPVQPHQPGQPVPDQHPVHRRGVQPQDPGDPSRTQPAVPAQRQDRRLGGRIGARRAAPRPRRAVQQPGTALGPIAGQPLVGGGPGDPHLRGHMSSRATSQNTFHQLQT